MTVKELIELLEVYSKNNYSNIKVFTIDTEEGRLLTIESVRLENHNKEDYLIIESE